MNCTAMTKLLSASIVLLPALLLGGCGSSDRSATRAAAVIPDQRPAANQTPASTPATDAQPGVNAQGAAALEFQKRIQAYLKIHNAAEAKVPNLKKTDDPKKVDDPKKTVDPEEPKKPKTAESSSLFSPALPEFPLPGIPEPLPLRSTLK